MRDRRADGGSGVQPGVDEHGLSLADSTSGSTLQLSHRARDAALVAADPRASTEFTVDTGASGTGPWRRMFAFGQRYTGVFDPMYRRTVGLDATVTTREQAAPAFVRIGR